MGTETDKPDRVPLTVILGDDKTVHIIPSDGPITVISGNVEGPIADLRPYLKNPAPYALEGSDDTEHKTQVHEMFSDESLMIYLHQCTTSSPTSGWRTILSLRGGKYIGPRDHEDVSMSMMDGTKGVIGYKNILAISPENVKEMLLHDPDGLCKAIEDHVMEHHAYAKAPNQSIGLLLPGKKFHVIREGKSDLTTLHPVEIELYEEGLSRHGISRLMDSE
ncbi:MAG: hypothetical protein KJ709_05215 [Nanoarchaeota archaeon]|nr:hypothetical protein [Nanoarchaeota archaeon]